MNESDIEKFKQEFLENSSVRNVDKLSISEVVSTFSDIAAVSIGAPPCVGVLGAVSKILGEALKSESSDVLSRHLSFSEINKIKTAILLMNTEIRNKGLNGQLIRQDQEFLDLIEDYTPLVESYEGTLLKVRDTFEWKKILYIAKLLANFFYIQEFSIEELNSTLQKVSSLTYRQFVILSLCHMKNEGLYGDLKKESLGESEGVPHSPGQISLMREVFDLYTSGYLSFHSSGKTDYSTSFNAVLDCFAVNPWEMCLYPPGERLVELLGLDEIPKMEVDVLSKLFK